MYIEWALKHINNDHSLQRTDFLNQSCSGMPADQGYTLEGCHLRAHSSHPGAPRGGWRDGMNAHPNHHPAGGRDPIPSKDHGILPVIRGEWRGRTDSGTGGVVSRLISRSSEGQLVIDRAASPDTWPSGGRPSAPDPPDERYTRVHLNSQACRADGPPGGYFPEGHGDVQTRQDPAAGSHYTVCANIFISDKNSRNTGRSLMRIPYTWARSRSE